LHNTSLCLNFVSNVRVRSIFSIYKLGKSNILFSRRVLAFFLLFNYIFKNNTITSITFFIKPEKIKKFNILRAPYKNKIAQNAFTWSRYYYSITFFFKNGVVPNANSLTIYCNTLSKFNYLLSTNVSNIKRTQIKSNFFLKI